MKLMILLCVDRADGQAYIKTQQRITGGSEYLKVVMVYDEDNIPIILPDADITLHQTQAFMLSDKQVIYDWAVSLRPQELSNVPQRTVYMNDKPMRVSFLDLRWFADYSSVPPAVHGSREEMRVFGSFRDHTGTVSFVASDVKIEDGKCWLLGEVIAFPNGGNNV